jgi:hypothetical protein
MRMRKPKGKYFDLGNSNLWYVSLLGKNRIKGKIF